MKITLQTGRVVKTKRRIQKHGMSGTPEHKMWLNIRQRCGNPRNPDFRGYGARLKPCIWPAWKRSLKAFIAHVGRRPGPGYSINRIDGSKGYVPGNVEWSTAKEQATNRSTTRVIEHGGIRRSMADWARALGITYRTLQYRLSHGWTMEHIIADLEWHLDSKNAATEIKSKAVVAVLTEIMFGRKVAA